MIKFVRDGPLEAIQGLVRWRTIFGPSHFLSSLLCEE
jgi:hypothetical protein